jgi:hypothetical protein
VVGCSSRASTRVGFKREPGAPHRATATLERGVGELRLEEAVTPREVQRPAPLTIGATRAFPYRRARVYHGGARTEYGLPRWGVCGGVGTPRPRPDTAVDPSAPPPKCPTRRTQRGVPRSGGHRGTAQVSPLASICPGRAIGMGSRVSLAATARRPSRLPYRKHGRSTPRPVARSLLIAEKSPSRVACAMGRGLGRRRWQRDNFGLGGCSKGTSA